MCTGIMGIFFFSLLKAPFTVRMEELWSGIITISKHDSSSICSESHVFSIFVSDLGNGKEFALYICR